jgi:hypothetical protein
MRRFPAPAIVLWLVSLLALAASGPASAAAERLFSYDPANDVTWKTAGPLTIQFRQRLVFTTVLNIRSTQGQATADLKPVDERVLGPGGLSRLIGRNAQERDLYEVEAADEGADLIKAFCPGATHAWMAFGRVGEAKPLRIRVLGDGPGGGARLCQTFEFSYRGEWKLPPGPGVKAGDLLSSGPRFP